MTETTTLRADRSGERLDVFIARRIPELTRSRARKLIDEGLVNIDGALAAKAGAQLDAGDKISVTIPQPEPVDLQPEAMPLRIVYEDAD